MSKRTYTDEQLKEAILKSDSWRQVLSKIGLVEAGGNYHAAQQVAEKLKLNTDHFLGQGWRKGSTEPVVKPIPLETILVENSSYKGSNSLRKRLIREGVKKAQCEACNRIKWMTKPIPLELDHINGVKTDNRIINLRLLCPNCHAQTPTYRGKNAAIRKNKLS